MPDSIPPGEPSNQETVEAIFGELWKQFNSKERQSLALLAALIWLQRSPEPLH